MAVSPLNARLQHATSCILHPTSCIRYPKSDILHPTF
jgi:hypothetical protein